MEEIWKDIEGYEGLYQVSNTGKVRKYIIYRSKWKNLKLMKNNDCFSYIIINNTSAFKARGILLKLIINLSQFLTNFNL